MALRSRRVALACCPRIRASHVLWQRWQKSARLRGEQFSGRESYRCATVSTIRIRDRPSGMTASGSAASMKSPSSSRHPTAPSRRPQFSVWHRFPAAIRNSAPRLSQSAGYRRRNSGLIGMVEIHRDEASVSTCVVVPVIFRRRLPRGGAAQGDVSAAS